jgi:hypothetical protein
VQRPGLPRVRHGITVDDAYTCAASQRCQANMNVLHDQRDCTMPQHSFLFCKIPGSIMGAHGLQPQQAATGRHQSACLAQRRLHGRRAAAPWHIDRWLAHLHHPKLSSEVRTSRCSCTGRMS